MMEQYVVVCRMGDEEIKVGLGTEAVVTKFAIDTINKAYPYLFLDTLAELRTAEQEESFAVDFFVDAMLTECTKVDWF